MKLMQQKVGQWNNEDRLELAKLLVKGGYQVAIRREKPEGKPKFLTYIEVIGDAPARDVARMEMEG